ncbi:MAG: hypothetical protein U0821_10905 [Chloroflexota bacterium]
MLARVIEAAGIATVQISALREHTEKVRPPRALFVPFMFGRPLGEPDDVELQHQVLARALALLGAPSGPVLEEFDWEGASRARIVTGRLSGDAPDVPLEIMRLRPLYERFVERTGRTSVGLTGVSPTRFRGLARFLEAYAAGRDADTAERPAGVPTALWIRYACDDIKAFYTEALMGLDPDGHGPDAMTWFWNETLAGPLVRAVATRMAQSEDPGLRAIATGIAR